MPKLISFKELFDDDYLVKILSSANCFKSVSEISSECKIPIASCYRRIQLLKKFKMIDTTGVIIEGTKINKYKRNESYSYQKHNTKAREILDAINKDPGISITRLKKFVSCSNLTLGKHLTNLIKYENIFLKKTKRKTWLFPININKTRMNSIINLQNYTNKKILTVLLKKDRADFMKLKKESGKNTSTISTILHQLREQGLVKQSSTDNATFELVDKELIKNCMENSSKRAF
jgi:predicted transcriptional regulator